MTYAYHDGTNWQKIIVDDEGDVGTYSSIGTNEIGDIFISYRDKDKGNLKLAMNINAQWQNFIIDDEGDVGEFTSLVITNNDEVIISYRDKEDANLKIISTFIK